MAGAYLTETPGVGGRLRERPEDFRVEEIPLRPPDGDGEYLHLLVEKRGVSTLEALRALRRALNLDEDRAGCAGLKDANAVARQWLSFRLPEREAADALPRAKDAAEGVRVLEAARSRSGLRRGALAGNRFEILIREVAPGAEERARTTLDALLSRGLPNAFGDQRFGAHGHTARIGLALARRDWRGALDAMLGAARLSSAREGADARLLEAARRYEAGDFGGARRLCPASWEAERRVLARLEGGASPGRAAAAIPARERALYGGALQAAVFNLCLARRLEARAHDRVWAGDALFHHPSGRARRAGAAEKEADAAARFETSPAGPLIGRKLLEARGEPRKMERSVLESLGVGEPAILDGLAGLGLYGARRPYRARMSEARLEMEGANLRLRFTLPPGAYASEALRELTKGEPPVGAVARLGEAGGTGGASRFTGEAVR